MNKLLLLISLLFLSFASYSQKLLFGIIDSTENIIVPFDYEDIMPWDYNSSLYMAKRNSKWGAIDSIGNVKIPFIYNDRFRIEKKFIIFKSENNKYGVLDFDGNILIEPSYESLWALRRGDQSLIGAVKENNKGRVNNKDGIINLKGDIIIPFEYSRIRPFTENYFIVSKTFYDEKGHIHSPYGLIDIENNIILPLDYTTMEVSESNNLICGKFEIGNDENGKYIGVKNSRYNVFTPLLQKRTHLEYEDINYANDSIAVIKKNNKWGIIKLDGNDRSILPFQYVDIDIFGITGGTGGSVTDSLGKKGLYAHESIVTDFKYSDIDIIYFADEYLYRIEENIEKDGKMFDMVGVIDEKGEVALPSVYDYQDLHYGEAIEPVNRNAFIIAKETDDNNFDEGVYGVVDSENRTIFPFKYQKIQNSIEYYYSTGNHRQILSTFLFSNWALFNEDGLWSIIDINTKEKIISGYAQINGYYNGNYVVGKYY